MSYRVVLHFINGSLFQKTLPSFIEARRFCRDHISLGPNTKRIEIHQGQSIFALWDSSWDAQSQYAGLHS